MEFHGYPGAILDETCRYCQITGRMRVLRVVRCTNVTHVDTRCEMCLTTDFVLLPSGMGIPRQEDSVEENPNIIRSNN